MSEFSFSRRRRLMVPALSITAALAGALLCAGGPAAAEDAASPNVIVDDSVFNGPAGGSATGSGTLPAPAHQPVSHLVTAGQSEVEAATSPETTSGTTYQAVPTTPIQSTSLDGSQEPATEATTTPAAGEAAATPADSAAAADGSGQTPQTTPEANAQTGGSTPPAGEAGAEQTAAKPPIDGMLRVTFEPESRKLSDATKAQLAPLIEKLKSDFVLRVQILAYAGGNDDASSHARGVSLARALAMRDYLTGEGITVDRMEIKALGNTAQEEPADRVDLVPLTE
jgi:outer membrane protein OmpA-like peptidoglycan-associated protein